MDTALYFRYHTFLESVLTPARLLHSLGVMLTMQALAEIYHLDPDQAATAGLLHDAAKDLPPSVREALFQEAHIPLAVECDADYTLYLHGPVGAYFIQQQLHVDDPLVLDAIAAHTFSGSGPNDDAPLSWCLRFADLLEPGRVWSNNARWLRAGLGRLRAAVYAGRLEEGIFRQTGLLIQFYTENNMPVHPNVRRIYQQQVEALHLTEADLADETLL